MTENKNVDTTKTTTHLGLCAGYGGIELGLHRVIPNLRSVALCEIEAFACANLVAKMEAGLMEPAPIWTDLKTFPWSEFPPVTIEQTSCASSATESCQQQQNELFDF